MPFNNAGGSIRSGLFVIVAGWICHRFAKAWSSRRATSEKQTTHVLGAPGRPTGRLNSAALAFLISYQPFPCVILDLRDCEQSETLLHGVAVKLGCHAVQTTLTDDAKWLTCCKGGGRPSPHHALVFVSETKVPPRNTYAYPYAVIFIHSAVHKSKLVPFASAPIGDVRDQVQAKLHAATAAASLHGFCTCFTVMAKRPLEPPQQEPPEPRLISSDALAHLMNIRGASGDAKLPVFVDVRRHDERTLFGCINGSVHIPAEDIALALQSSNDMFEQIARTPAWAKEDAVVFHSRGTCRAQWAAIIAAQQGYVNVLVLSGGTNEWQFQPSVLRYAHYEFGDPIPAAIAPVVRSVNFDEAAEDLLILGLL